MPHPPTVSTDKIRPFCRTCSRQMSDSISSTSLDCQSLKRLLTFCVPEMDLRTLPDTKLCEDCVVALNLTYKFKIKCLEVETGINKRQFNVIERLLIKRESSLDNSGHTTCRTCLNDITDYGFRFMAKGQFYKYKLTFCIPEMDLRVTSDVKMCSDCQTAIDQIYVFKLKCLGQDRSVKEYTKLHGIVDFKESSAWCTTSVKNEINDADDFVIKQEEIVLDNKDEIIDDLNERAENGKFVSVKIEETRDCGYAREMFKCTSRNNSERADTAAQKNDFDASVDKKPFKCSQCDYSAARKFQLRQHIDSHTGERPFNCFHCEFSTSVKTNLILHVRKHTGEKPFECSQCDYKAARKFQLKQHIHIHANEKPFKCSYCEYSAAQKPQLQQHIRMHTGERPFKCSQCDYSAIRKYQLKQHTATHTGEKPHKCPYCDHSAAQKSQLKQHIRTHTGEKPFSCSQCNFTASIKTNLILHIRTHTGEKPFKCSQCEYSAARKFQLKQHALTHTSERPFKCSYCIYSTAHKFQIKQHTLTHIGEKSFKCSQCDYSAALKSTFNKHVRKHNGKLLKCPQCKYSTVYKSNLKLHSRVHAWQ